ncbi:hypothetical protein BC833DRAFT_656105 [Globomyces pollinis-pini]|nr:hypothetical protein BC833DRAFT_656105 [Globomyces pollinis-pini]
MSWVFDHVTPLSLIAGWDPRSSVVRSDNHPHLGPCQHTPLRGLGNYHFILIFTDNNLTKIGRLSIIKTTVGTNRSHSIHWDQSKSNLISLALNTQTKPKSVFVALFESWKYLFSIVTLLVSPSIHPITRCFISHYMPLKILLVSSAFHNQYSYQLEMDEKYNNYLILIGLVL